MTRFARAKGSKSSNERAPEDSTPWDVMKEQLLKAKKENEDSKKREEAENQRLQNYQKFLQDQKVQKKKASWCEFPETQSTSEPPIKKKKKQKSKKGSTESNNEIVVQTETEDVAQNTSEPPTKNRNKPKKGSIACTNEMQSNNYEEVLDTLQKAKKRNKNKTKCTPDGIDKPSEYEVNVELPIDNKKTNMIKENNANKLSETSNEQPVKSAQYDESCYFNPNNQVNSNKGKKQKKKKPTKFVDGKPVRRKEINDRSFQLIINGKEVELVRFDGFPIMRKDAERLGELKNNMIKKGIPKSEVQRTMKLERRRAEKALARMKREVCYNCRKGGHNLSDCPDLKSKIPGVDAAEGVCFKCGSTEHKQFECKVQKDKEFKFATCFICKEPGHIARQCPDNPKGLYPNGGSCKLCGDVTHLRKDCPTVQDQREESSIKLQTLDNNIEDIGIKIKTETMKDATKKPKKIKF